MRPLVSQDTKYGIKFHNEKDFNSLNWCHCEACEADYKSTLLGKIIYFIVSILQKVKGP